MDSASAPGTGDDRPDPVMAGRTLLVLGSAGPSKRGLFEAASKRGLRVVLVKENPGWEREYSGDVLPVDCRDYDDLDKTVRQVTEFASRHRAGGAITTSDAAIPALAEVTAQLGMAGPAPEAAAVLRSKALMRRRFDELGLPSAKSAAVSGHGEAISAAAAIGYPVIAKPAVGTGSVGVLLARDAGELAAAWDTAGRLTGGLPDSLVIEEFLDGREVIVDAVAEHGRIIFHNIVDNPQDQNGPTFEQLEFVTPTSLPAELAEQVYEVNRRTILGLGLTSAVTHTQMKVTSRGPRLIEIHPRVAGARVPEITRSAWGVDLYDAAIHIAMGVPLQISQKPSGYAGYRCIYPHRAGLFTAIRGIAEAGKVPGVTGVEVAISPPCHIETLPAATQQNIGYIFARGSTPEHARHQMDAALRLISLDIA